MISHPRFCYLFFILRRHIVGSTFCFQTIVLKRQIVRLSGYANERCFTTLSALYSIYIFKSGSSKNWLHIFTIMDPDVRRCQATESLGDVVLGVFFPQEIVFKVVINENNQNNINFFCFFLHM